MRLTLLIVAAAVATGGCGKKVGEVIPAHEAAFEKLRGQLAAVSKAVQAATGDACEEVDGLTYGTGFDIAHVEQLTDSEFDLKKAGRVIDILASENLLHCLTWMGPDSPLSPDTDGENVEKALKTCEGLTHVLVAREMSHDRKAARLELRYDLARLDDAAIVCSFTTTSTGDPSKGVVDYDLVETNTKTGEERVVRSDSRDEYSSIVWSAARKDLEAAVKAKLGVELNLR